MYKRLFSIKVIYKTKKIFEIINSSFFFLSRPYRHHFITLVALMLDTGLPCFRGHTLEQLNARLKPDSSEAEAARYMHEVINRCAHSLRTRLYDYIQYQQNSIPY